MVAVLGCVGLWAGGTASGGEGQRTVCGSEQRVASDNAPTLVLRRDSGPEDDSAASEPQRSFEAPSSRSAGLVERSGVTEAGGVMVGLRGRFRTTLVLERKADGSTASRCISNLPDKSAGDH
jgi:hypothetical protein